MKKLLKICSFVVVISTMTVSCQKDEITSLAEPSLEDKSKVSYEVTINEAIQVAQNYAVDSSYATTSGARVGSTNDIDTKETVSDENSKPLFHVINYAKNGFVIVSADLRAMPILAYSASSKFDVKNAPNINGLSLWFTSAKNQMKEIRKSTDKADSIVIKEWQKYLKKNLNLPKGGRVATNTNCQEWYTTGQFMCQNSTYSKGPLLSTSWGQVGVFNANAPVAVCQCGRDPAGCGPVAMAQIVKYHKPINSLSFGYSSMQDSPNFNCSPSSYGDIEIARLMRACGLSSGSVYHFASTCNTLTYTWNIPGGLQAMGLSNGGSLTAFNFSTIINEIYQGNPVILHATNSDPIITGFDQHIWVCDGFYQNNYSQYNCDTKACDTWSYSYLYLNWGWYGNSNGWYSAGNFSPTHTSGTYNKNMYMITGIRK